MRHVRLIGLLLAVLIALTLVPVVSAERAVTATCADGCPPGPRPTQH